MCKRTRIVFVFLVISTVCFNVRSQNETITNRDVINLTQERVNKAIIIKKIRASNPNFDLSTNGLIELKKAGVDDDVVSLMFEAKSVDIGSVASATKDKPAKPPANGSSSTAASTDADDPMCLIATLSKPDTTDYMKNICRLAEIAIAQDTPELIMDKAATPLLKLFIGEVAKRNKLFINDAEKREAAKDLFLEADKKRTDKQIGGTPSSAGSTSLAVKGGSPSIIGWAVEQGAATSSISGNTVTVRINPFGLLNAIQGEGFLGSNFLNNLTSGTNNSSSNSDVKFNNFLRKFSTGFSFDTTRGQASPTLIVSKQQLSAVSVRYEFINQRTPQSKEAQNLFRQFVKDNSGIYNKYDALITSLEDDNNGTFKNHDLQNWLDATNKKIQDIPNPATQKAKSEAIKKLLGPGDKKLEKILDLVSPFAQGNYKEAVRKVIEEQIVVFPVDELLNDPVVKTAFESFANLSLNYVGKRKAFTDEVNKGTVAAFEYTNFREPIAPDTSNFRFIWENGRFFKNTDFTFNASLTMYNKKPTFVGVKRIRDFQFTLQSDTSLGNTFGTGNTILTFAGSYQRLNGDTVDALGRVKPNSKGDMAVGQFKWTIPIADWGIKLPLSVTFANRSDLIKESTVRANFGFTFDLDPIFARFKPF